MLSNLRVLVTGGAGFIGSHLVESLVGQGAKVRVFDNFSFGSWENLAAVASQVEVIEGDVRDFESLSRAARGIDIISHQAAQLEIFRAIADPKGDMETNTIGTLNVLEAARTNGVSKVINASSACIYGQVQGPVAESHYPRPNWAYGASKFAAELYANIYNDYYGVPVVNLRYGITYGEREWYRRALTIFLKRAFLGEPLVVFGDGSQIRDFVYVKDIVALHNLCIVSPKANGQCYNGGTGVATSITELARTIIEVTGSKSKLVFEETPEGEYSKLAPEKKRNAAELKMMLLDIGKARRELGWQPKTSLKEGLYREFCWLKENMHRWKQVVYTKV